MNISNISSHKNKIAKKKKEILKYFKKVLDNITEDDYLYIKTREEQNRTKPQKTKEFKMENLNGFNQVTATSVDGEEVGTLITNTAFDTVLEAMSAATDLIRDGRCPAAAVNLKVVDIFGTVAARTHRRNHDGVAWTPDCNRQWLLSE